MAEEALNALVAIIDPETPAEEATERLLAYRAEVLTTAATRFDRMADKVEAAVAAHYAIAIGNGSADMIREAANRLRSMVGPTTPAAPAQKGAPRDRSDHR